MTTGPSRFDVIVVGGGIVGCSAAFYLARRGLAVALVERHSLGGGTTSASFAWINATAKVADDTYLRLNAMGTTRHRELAAEFGEEDLGYYQAGMLQWVNTDDESRLKAMRHRAERLQALDYPVATVGARVFAALEPHVRCGDDGEAMVAMADAWLDAPRFARRLAGELRAMGSLVLEQCAAKELSVSDDGVVTGVVTEQGRLEATRVVVAAGADTPDILGKFTGVEANPTRFPINRVPGLLVTSPSTAPARLLRHITYFDVEPGEIHLRPAPNGGLRMGARETDGWVAEDPSPERVRRAAIELLRRAKAVLPGFPGEACIDACDIAIGIRPVPHDGKSIAGPFPGAEGLYLIATHSGITLAPALGDLMAEAIANGVTPELLRPFSLKRFPGFA